MKPFLSPRELGEAIGVSESSLKRWADEGRLEVGRTAGGHRRIRVADAVKFIRESGLPVLKPQVLGLEDLLEVSGGAAAEESAALEDALLAGHGPRVRGIILSMYLSGRSVAQICDGPIAEAMHHIGALWKHDDAGVFIEHRATDLCMQALHHLRVLMPMVDPSAPVAVGGCVSGDPYALASLMAATVLAGEGWREMNLGPDTPLDSMYHAAERSGALLVWIGVHVQVPDEYLPKRIAHLAERLQPLGVKVIGGGRSWPRRSSESPANLYEAASMAELASFAQGLRSVESPA